MSGCLRCGTCCKHWRIPVQPYDDVPAELTVGDGAYKSMRMLHDGSCAALTVTGCAIHARRPVICRSFLCQESGGPSTRPLHTSPVATAAVVASAADVGDVYLELREAVTWLMERLDAGQVEWHNSHGLELLVKGEYEGAQGPLDQWADLLVRLYRRNRG